MLCFRLPSSWCAILLCGRSTPSRHPVLTPTQHSSTSMASGPGPSFPTYQCLSPSSIDFMSPSASVRYGKDLTSSRMNIRVAYMCHQCSELIRIRILDIRHYLEGLFKRKTLPSPYFSNTFIVDVK